ncbi:MAG: acyl-CoA dehydrogenase [Pseudomonadota bacterium]|mgnify:FL=1|nr:MAG: acyl-CoA dehydrogenase [Pseudomonadota bacterium]
MYRAPLSDIRFVLEDLLDTSALSGMPGLEDYSSELATAVLEEAARFAEDVLDPLNQTGDREGARWTPDGVVMPAGFKDAYEKFVEGGWPQLGADPEYGGQPVPIVLGTAVQELWASANLSFKLCPMLTAAAVEALELRGTPEQKRLFLPKMVSGEWTGTMNLTEPQAGSDLALVRMRAVPDGSHYRLFGQKIFITYGDHDYTENIIHMVLARIDGAPPGVRGISLFLVPKVLVNDDGSLGARNDVRCTSIEHKLGIHASPTCVMTYGEREGAIGYLIGEPNRGLEYMFIMMNAARLSVGVEGYALAERAFQRAAEWARNRLQGRPPGAKSEGPVPIVQHPDVRRMLLTMKSGAEAMRALALYAAYQFDLARHHPDERTRAAAQARGELLIPIVKGFCTENGVRLASLGIQVHGGMGYVEETGAAQHLRDVRITTIYEGTTGIQSNDLVGRKIGRDRGAAMGALIEEMRRELESLPVGDGEGRAVVNASLEAVERLEAATRAQLAALGECPERAYAVAVPYLELCGTAICGWLMAKAYARAAEGIAGGDAQQEFHRAKLRTAQFFAQHTLPNALALARVVEQGASSVIDTDAALI